MENIISVKSVQFLLSELFIFWLELDVYLE